MQKIERLRPGMDRDPPRRRSVREPAPPQHDAAESAVLRRVDQFEINSGIALFAGGLYGVRTGLYCVLGLLAKAFVVDGVIDGINQRKKVTIVSRQAKAIEQFIMQKLRRSATVRTAYGAYTHREVEEITTVLTRAQAVALRNFIRKTDPDAFITIVNTSETIGKGFRAV